MAAAARDRTRRWEPFGVTKADFAAAPDRDGVRVVNVTPGGPGPGQAGWWLRGAAVALGVLAAAAAAVSWDAQYAMVRAAKPVPVVAALEAGIPDVGAVVFAALGVALALHGKRALRSRALNAACIGISLGMNALAAGRGWRDLAIWVMPAAVYAVASDTLIGVVRAWVLARARQQGETVADDGLSPLAAAAGLALWLLRLSLAPRSTLTGFRTWVVTDCPVAPGLRPGHLAELEAARQDADQRIALAAREYDEAVEQAAAAARQARDEATRARAAETGIRAELDRTRADASQLITQALADAAAERGDLRAQSEQHVERLRTELQQVRADAARLVDYVRDSAAARIAVMEEAAARLQAERDQLAAGLRAAHRPSRTSAWIRREARPTGPRGARATKRGQMIELAGQRRDLASVPLAEVSQLASSVAAEIGYSPGTARRELVRYVRGLQAASSENQSTPDTEEGTIDD
jgi:hypothetical protein